MLAMANIRKDDVCVLNLQASWGVFAGNEIFVSLQESSASSSSNVVEYDFLYLSGIVSSSSRSKLLVMFSNMASTFAITSREAGRPAEAIEDVIGFYGIKFLLTQSFIRSEIGWHSMDFSKPYHPL